jgi:hypothetical protein
MVRSWLMEADPSALAAPTDAALSAHIAVCAPCQARLRRVLGDTAMLERAVASPGYEHAPLFARQSAAWRRGARIAGGSLLAASLVWAIVHRLSRPDHDGGTRGEVAVLAASVEFRSSASSASDSLLPGALPAGQGNDRRDERRGSGRRVTGGRLPAHSLSAYQALANSVTAPVPVLAVRLDTVDGSLAPRRSLSVAHNDIDVHPDSGRRFAVLRASPNGSVVWFY